MEGRSLTVWWDGIRRRLGRRNEDTRIPGAWLTGLLPPEREAQQGRLAWLVRRGRIVLLAGAALTTATALLALAQGYQTAAAWLTPLGCLAFAGLFHLAYLGFANRPPGSVEVPLDLVDPLTEMCLLVADLEYEAADSYDEIDERLAIEARKRLTVVGQLANDALAADRAGQPDRARELRDALSLEYAGLADLQADAHGAAPVPTGPDDPLEYLDEPDPVGTTDIGPPRSATSNGTDGHHS